MYQSDNFNLRALAEKLDARTPLSTSERAAILDLPHKFKTLRRHEFIAREDEVTRECCVLLAGFAIRHKVAGNGLRQIFSIHMRGDPVDLHNSLLGKADHNLEMLSTGEAAFVPIEAIRNLTQTHPRIGQALWNETLIEASIMREWQLNAGRRDSRSRMSHLMCELSIRLERARLGQARKFDLPMTQEELADALALTPIHVNRTLKSLEAEGLIGRTNRAIAILDWHRLVKLGDFDASYLHFGEVGP